MRYTVEMPLGWPPSKDPADYQGKGWYVPPSGDRPPSAPARLAVPVLLGLLAAEGLVVWAAGGDGWTWLRYAPLVLLPAQGVVGLVWRRRLKRRASRTSP